jgi:hypothetical protein
MIDLAEMALKFVRSCMLHYATRNLMHFGEHLDRYFGIMAAPHGGLNDTLPSRYRKPASQRCRAAQ